MSNVKITPAAADLRARGPANAYVVEQGRLLQEFQVRFFSLQISGDPNGLSSHQSAVLHNNIEAERVGKVLRGSMIKKRLQDKRAPLVQGRRLGGAVQSPNWGRALFLPGNNH